MQAKRPIGARNETTECEHCGERYAITYKRCPFCNGKPARRQDMSDDQPTLIFRRPTREELEAAAQEPPRRGRREREDDFEELPPRRLRRDTDAQERPIRRGRRAEPEDEYEDEPMRRFVPESNLDGGYKDDDYDDDYDDEPRSGRRLVRGGQEEYRRRGPSIGRIIGAILSIALIAAAAYIVFLVVSSLSGKGGADPAPSPTPSVPPAVTAPASPSPGGSETPEPGTSVAPSPSPSGEPQPTAPATVPPGQTATGFTLTDRAGKRKQDITLNAQDPNFTFTVAFSPAGSTGSITWSSSKPEIVSVDQNGKATALAKGVATITATMAGGYSQQCIIRSGVGNSPSVSPSAPPTAPSVSPSPSPSPSADKPAFSNVSGGNDFTLKGAGDSWTLKLKNAVGTPSWSVKDSSVATVDQSGKVTAVAKGVTVVTATVDGQTLECTVRVAA